MSLQSTLGIAIRQSKDLLEEIEQKSNKIDQLLKENERLRQELQQFHQNRTKEDNEEKQLDQLDGLFRMVAEKQAEIDRLNLKIRMGEKRGFDHPTSNRSASTQTTHDIEISRDSIVVQPIERKRMSTVETMPSIMNKKPKTVDVNIPLKEISGNFARTPTSHSSDKAKSMKRRNEEKHIDFLTEDGEVYMTRRENNKISELSSSRLEGLLLTPSPAHPLLTKAQKIYKDVSQSSHENVKENLSVAPVLSNSKSTLGEKSMPQQSFLGFRRQNVPGSEDDEPLRARPLHRLNLSNFKPNPNRNNGFDHAYQDVIRKRDLRRCLPGCTRPECCGNKFKAVADSLPRQESFSDDKLLHDFLGPGSEGKIRNLTKIARENLIHEAKVKQIADKHGKMHKTLHQRPKSPPGFWRVDFAGSQEEARDRELARIEQRKEIEQRYNEAMIPNGRWMFADE